MTEGFQSDYIRNKLVEINGQEYLVDATVTYYIDPAYGADADGNRGVTKTEVDDVDIHNVTDLDGVPVIYDKELFDLISEVVV